MKKEHIYSYIINSHDFPEFEDLNLLNEWINLLNELILEGRILYRNTSCLLPSNTIGIGIHDFSLNHGKVPPP
jgi:hypothetical protein